MGAFDIITWRGKRMDRRTAAGFEHWEDLLGDELTLTQGCWSQGGVAASSDTHDGSGAVDAQYFGRKPEAEVQRSGRMAGFAVWRRPKVVNLWPEHYHGIQIGNPQVSAGAAKQVQDFFAGLDGLASHSRDSTWRPNPIVPFRYPLGVVDLSVVKNQAEARNPDVRNSVKHVQRALNLKTGATLRADGVFGESTRRAYRRYELQTNPDSDGRPSAYSLRRLGAARFRVKP